MVIFGGTAGGAVTPTLLLAVTIFIAAYIHAASINDFADREIDAVNLPTAKDRPLLSQDVSFKQLWIVHGGSGLFALLGSAVLGWKAVVVTSGMLVLGYAYSLKPIRMSDRGAASQLLLAVAYVFYPLALGFWASTQHAPFPWILALGIYLGFVARLFLKDFRDVKGDKAHGKLTFLLRHGQVATCAVSGLLSVGSLLLILRVVNYAPGLTILLALGQIAAIYGLTKLSTLPAIDDQVRTVKILARLANIAVLALLFYWLGLNHPALMALAISLLPIGLGLIVVAASEFPTTTQPNGGSVVPAN